MKHQEPGFEIVYQMRMHLGLSTIVITESGRIVFDITMTPGKETEIKTWIAGKWEEKTYGPPEVF